MYIAGDKIEDIIPLSDGSLIVKDMEKGNLIYDRPRPSSQITSSQWEEALEVLRRRHVNDAKPS